MRSTFWSKIVTRLERWRLSLALTGILVAPFVVLLILKVAVYHFYGAASYGYVFSFAIAFFLGLISCFLLPTKSKWSRVGTAALYVPLMFVILLFFNALSGLLMFPYHP